jgi:hypothetical protein
MNSKKKTSLPCAFGLMLLSIVCVDRLLAAQLSSFDAPIEFYLIEKTGSGKNEKISFSKTKALFLKQLKLAGFHILDDIDPPFVSKGMVRYGNTRAAGTSASGIGYIHLSLTDDEKTHYLSDSGTEVFLKSDLNKVDWIFEQKKALEMADKAGAKYAFVVEVDTQLVYQDDSPKPVYQVNLKADLYEVDKGKTLFHREESMVKLAEKANAAVLGACQFLSPQLADEVRDTLVGTESR